MRVFDRSMLIIAVLMVAALALACRVESVDEQRASAEERARRWCAEMKLTPVAVRCTVLAGLDQCDVHTAESGVVALRCWRSSCRAGAQ